MNLDQIIKQALQYAETIPKHQNILDVYEGNLIEHVKKVLATELSPQSYKIASKRIPSINLMTKINKKLSQAYKNAPRRTTEDSGDLEILSEYELNLGLNRAMSEADVLLNLSKSFAIEPYVENGRIQLRVLKPDQFMVISDSITNPSKATILVKFMGSVEVNGKKQLSLWVYTDSVFIRCLSDGTVLEQSFNPYGMLPFVYGKANSFLLQPEADMDFYENVMLIPRILSDLNYAVQYMSHSRVYGIDIDPTKVNISPDSMTIFQSREGSGDKTAPQLGMINPSVDVDKVLSLCKFTVANILDTKGIKASGMNSLDASSVASGVSKIIDEADVHQVVEENRNILQQSEKQLWKLIGAIHNTHVGTDNFEYSKGLNSPFEVSVSFPTIRVLPDPTEQRENLKFQLEAGLITKKRALMKLNPDLTEDEIDQMVAELIPNKENTNE